MSVALALMGTSAVLGVVGGMQQEEALKQKRKLQKYNEESLKTQTKIQSASLIENQYKSFSAFMEGHTSVIASQENYLNATGYDERGTVRQGVYQQQKEDFYASQQTTESNIRDVESRTQLALLGQQAQNEINKNNYERAIVDNRFSTLTSFFGSATQIGMVTGAFGGGTTGGVAGGIPTQSGLSPRTGVPLLGYGDNSTILA